MSGRWRRYLFLCFHQQSLVLDLVIMQDIISVDVTIVIIKFIRVTDVPRGRFTSRVQGVIVVLGRCLHTVTTQFPLSPGDHLLLLFWNFVAVQKTLAS